MKDTWFRLFVVIVSLVIVLLLLAQYLPKIGVGDETKWLKEPPGAVVMTIVGAVIGGMILFLLKDRWNRIETEMLTLRTQQEKALEDLQKRADTRISEKMDAVTRQAQAIRDRTANLLDQHPWIKGVTDADFTPDSCSCQIVLRNAVKFVASGQYPLAHEYLFNWTRPKKEKQSLEGSVYDFAELARFAGLVLGDDYLAMLMLGQGYRAASQRRLISPSYLKAMIRLGLTQDATTLAESIRHRVFPNWITRARRWLFRKKHAFEPKPLIEEFTALALFDGHVGDPESFNKSIKRAKEMIGPAKGNPLAKALVVLNEAEGLAMLEDLESADQLLRSLPDDQLRSHLLANEVNWSLKSMGRNDEAHSLLKTASDAAREQIADRLEPQTSTEVDDEETEEPAKVKPMMQAAAEPETKLKKQAADESKDADATLKPPHHLPEPNQPAVEAAGIADDFDDFDFDFDLDEKEAEETKEKTSRPDVPASDPKQKG